ncbi:unnamed protein product [Ectocarpus sp. 4 AP-2014]
MSAMTSAPAQGMPVAEGVTETGLVGGIFSKAQHDGIRVKFSDVDWATIVRAGNVSQTEVEQLRANDESAVEFLMHDEAAAKKYVSTLVKIMKTTTSDARAQYFAVSRCEDIVADDGKVRSQLFLASPEQPLDQAPFLRVIDSGDAAAQQVASIVLALLIVNLDADSEPLTAWICKQLSMGRGRGQSVRGAVQALCVLLRNDTARISFGRHGGVAYLTKIIRMQGGDSSMAQLMYELCFCLWSVSLCDEVKQDFMSCGAIPILAQQVAAATSEKVIRVSLAALKHLTEGEAMSFNAEMIACGLPKTLRNMKTRQWADPDIKEDVDTLDTVLQRNSRDLSTFECYSQEVMSGQLKWGPVHTEKFWREQARKFEADEFFILKQLIELLKSEDKSVVSIACYDLGEFVRFYPSGKTIVKHLGAKERVMLLVDSEHKDVQRHALQCVSKIMVNKWEFIR